MQLRVARHTHDLKRIVHFYHEILGLELLGGFQNHNEYDGIFLGFKGSGWHLEFTSSNIQANHTPDEDDALVLYVENQEKFDALTQKLTQLGISKIKARNPYWNQHGYFTTDPDGFYVIIAVQN